MPSPSAITAAVRARRKGVAPNQPLVPGNALKTALPPPSVGQGRPLPPPGPLALPRDKRPDFNSVYDKPVKVATDGDSHGPVGPPSIQDLRTFHKDRKALVDQLVGSDRGALQKAQGVSADQLASLVAQHNAIKLGQSEGTAYTPEDQAKFAAANQQLQGVLAKRKEFLAGEYADAPRAVDPSVRRAQVAQAAQGVEPRPFRKGSVPKGVGDNMPAPSNPTYGKQGPSFPGAVPGAYARTTRPGGDGGNPIGSHSQGVPGLSQIQNHIRNGNPVYAPTADFLSPHASQALVNHGWTYNGHTNHWVPPRR